MAWLFAQKKEEAKKVDPEQALAGISKQLDNLSKKQMVYERRSKDLRQEAVNYKKTKNIRAAVLALKKHKLVEQELNKMDGMRMMLEQEKLALECTAHSDQFSLFNGQGLVQHPD